MRLAHDGLIKVYSSFSKKFAHKLDFTLPGV